MRLYSEIKSADDWKKKYLLTKEKVSQTSKAIGLAAVKDGKSCQSWFPKSLCVEIKDDIGEFYPNRRFWLVPYWLVKEKYSEGIEHRNIVFFDYKAQSKCEQSLQEGM